jgi:D-inositol-3-phosphate glycosyltransferase
VAAEVGGLRSLVDHGRTGYLVESRDPNIYAHYTASILDDPTLAADMSAAATERSWSYTWSATAARLRRVCDDLVSRVLVDCT